ncbi:MAG: exopolysaccharide biosynthesis polyprenyl glycosylphosphotransferase [Xanthomonadaceae bacterium]|nr:exopolysaccharide biosynthesis polyprenyl glycosylphosphotransferase [Xanthomonadaceae bacterium]
MPISRKISRVLSELLLSKDLRFYFVSDFAVSFMAFSLVAGWNPRVWMQTSAEIWISSLVFSLSFTGIALGTGLFEREHRFYAKSFIRSIAISCVLALISTLFVIYFALFWKIGRFLLVFGSIGALVGVLLYHWVLSLVLNKYPYRFVVIGEASPITQGLRGLGKRAKKWMNYLHLNELQEWFFANKNLSADQLAHKIQESRVIDVVMTDQAAKDPRATEFAIAAMQVGCRVIDEVGFYSEIHEAFPSQILSQNWFVFAGIDTRQNWSNFFKRIFDLSFASVCLVVLSPLLLILAFIVMVSSPGPVLFIQERQGRYRKPFKILKFRTMKLDVNGSENPPSTRANDPRVTWIGRLMRPLHLDELPQIWNILRGEMSFVGPRPEVYSFTQEIIREVPIYEFRCLVRPGLTGLSQIRVGYTLDNVEATFTKLAYDLYYVKNHSFVMDILIILRTAFVLTKKVH